MLTSILKGGYVLDGNFSGWWNLSFYGTRVVFDIVRLFIPVWTQRVVSHSWRFLFLFQLQRLKSIIIYISIVNGRFFTFDHLFFILLYDFLSHFLSFSI